MEKQIPGLTNFVGGLVSAMACLEAPSAILAATEGIGSAANGLGKEAHIDLLYKSQVRLVLIYMNVFFGVFGRGGPFFVFET